MKQFVYSLRDFILFLLLFSIFLPARSFAQQGTENTTLTLYPADQEGVRLVEIIGLPIIEKKYAFSLGPFKDQPNATIIFTTHENKTCDIFPSEIKSNFEKVFTTRNSPGCGLWGDGKFYFVTNIGTKLLPSGEYTLSLKDGVTYSDITPPQPQKITVDNRNNTPLDLVFSGGEAMTHPEIAKELMGGLNPEDLKGKAFYEKDNDESKKIQITLTGCTGETADFHWYDKKPLCDAAGKCILNSPGNPIGSATNISNIFEGGAYKATTEQWFDVKDQITIFTMQAKCSDGREIFEPFIIFPRSGHGTEFIIVPAEIEENTKWTMTLTGLQSPSNESVSSHPGCYFFQLIKHNDDGSITYVKNEANNRNKCEDGSGIDDKYSNLDENPYYLASSEWDPESEIEMPPLEKGNYEVRLYLMDKFDSKAGVKSISRRLPLIGGILSSQINDDNDDNVANREFCVGGGFGCTNEDLTIPPPPNPCPQELQNDNGTCSKVKTAIGTLSIEPGNFIKDLLRVLLSISGGIILLLIIRSGYQLMTSQGNPEKITEAKDRITSAIIGLLFLIFSLVILEVIGVDILNVPGFSG